MFLQREKELNELKNFLESTTATAAMIYGVRQIGKSSLILEAVKNSPNVLYFESLDSPIEENIFQLTRKASRQLGLPLLSSDDIISFFENLNIYLCSNSLNNCLVGSANMEVFSGTELRKSSIYKRVRGCIVAAFYGKKMVPFV